MAILPLNAIRSGDPEAPSLLILHGLLGSARNWTTIARALEAAHDVHCIDLRNHGDSPHAESMRYSDLAADLAAYIEHHDLEQVTLLGHSLGGKVAMRYACENPERVEQLIVADIVQRTYPPFHAVALDAMARLPLESLGDRRDADRALEATMPNWAFRQFILTNLARDAESGRFYWKVNLDALRRSLPIMARPSIEEDDQFSGPSLLIAGAKSDFVKPDDLPQMEKHFPSLNVHWLENAGHNVHVEDRSGFLEAIAPVTRL